jgi:hypothetical protein
VEVEMRIWIACFFILFAIAELFDWMKQMSLPLPIYILGGLILAIGSNSNKRIFGKVFDDFLTHAGYPGDRSIADSGDRILDETKS